MELIETTDPVICRRVELAIKLIKFYREAGVDVQEWMKVLETAAAMYTQIPKEVLDSVCM